MTDLERFLSEFMAKDHDSLAQDDDKWITIHPNGTDNRAVMIDDKTGVIKKGLAIGLIGTKLKDIRDNFKDKAKIEQHKARAEGEKTPEPVQKKDPEFEKYVDRLKNTKISGFFGGIKKVYNSILKDIEERGITTMEGVNQLLKEKYPGQLPAEKKEPEKEPEKKQDNDSEKEFKDRINKIVRLDYTPWQPKNPLDEDYYNVPKVDYSKEQTKRILEQLKPDDPDVDNVLNTIEESIKTGDWKIKEKLDRIKIYIQDREAWNKKLDIAKKWGKLHKDAFRDFSKKLPKIDFNAHIERIKKDYPEVSIPDNYLKKIKDYDESFRKKINIFAKDFEEIINSKDSILDDKARDIINHKDGINDLFISAHKYIDNFKLSDKLRDSLDIYDKADELHDSYTKIRIGKEQKPAETETVKTSGTAGEIENFISQGWNGKVYRYTNGDNAIFVNNQKILLTKEQLDYIDSTKQVIE